VTERAIGLEFATIAVIVYVIAGLLLWLPSQFLAIGLQALGASIGLWVGDPNTNDGEETWATAAGAFAALIVFGIAALAVFAFGRRYGLRAGTPIAIGTAALAVGYSAFWIWATIA